MTWKCDCCGAEMKYPHLDTSATTLHACEDCRSTAYTMLGREYSAVHIGPKK